MNIAYIADITSIHNYKWINLFSKENRVILFCEENAKIPQWYKENQGVKIYPILPPVYPLKNINLRYRVIKKIKEVIKDNNIDIIHSMYAVPYAIWAYHLKLKKHIITTRGSDILIDYNRTYKTANGFQNKLIGSFMRALVEKALNQAKYITSTSLSQQNVIRTFIADPSKLHLIRTGVNVTDFITLDTKTVRNGNIPTILSNRSMSALYNIDVIVDAYNIVRKKLLIDSRLVIMNHNTDAEYYKYIVERINEHGLQSHVQIIGEQNTSQLVQTYKNADVVVMIPASDGMPVSGIEAMLAKKPLIVGNVDYDNDIYNGNTVWKVKDISASALADEIIKLLSLHTDEIHLKTNEAYKAATEFADIKKEIKKVEDLYKSLM